MSAAFSQRCSLRRWVTDRLCNASGIADLFGFASGQNRETSFDSSEGLSVKYRCPFAGIEAGKHEGKGPKIVGDDLPWWPDHCCRDDFTLDGQGVADNQCLVNNALAD